MKSYFWKYVYFNNLLYSSLGFSHVKEHIRARCVIKARTYWHLLENVLTMDIYLQVDKPLIYILYSKNIYFNNFTYI